MAINIFEHEKPTRRAQQRRQKEEEPLCKRASYDKQHAGREKYWGEKKDEEQQWSSLGTGAEGSSRLRAYSGMDPLTRNAYS